MNFLRKKQNEAKGQGSRTQQVREREISPEEYAQITAQLKLMYNLKVMDNAFSKICMNKCLNYQNDILEDNERNCLENCQSKLTKFLQISTRIKPAH